MHLTEPTRRQAVWWMLLLLSLGFLIRCHRINEPPVLKSTRPYIGVLLSRHYYFEMSDNIPQWRRDRARESVEREGIMEPPLLPMVTATAFKLTGGERWATARLVVITGWMLGAFALYRLGRCWHSRSASLIGVALFLLMPFGIALSAATQPDGWMVAMTIVAWWRLVRAFRTGGLATALGAGLAAGAAILIKPTCLFVIAGAVATVLIKSDPNGRRRMRPSTLIAMALPSILVLALYYLPEVIGGSRLSSQAHMSFDPGLWISPDYYLNWFRTIGSTIGYIAAACIVVLLTQGCRTGGLRFQIGLWAGYLVYGLIFNHHVSTHDYYSLILVPMTALAAAGAIDCLQRQCSPMPLPKKGIKLAMCLVAAALAIDVMAGGKMLANPKEMARVTGRLVGINEAFLIYASHSY
ncbi:MAG TPA: glycosyltransferase family 39 protein, partial [Roseimicrobium sp.]|nr:glycosyltransferase family 39 protein [Roseimicrobium sp.]